MERIDISEDRRLADLVAAVERGEEVVIVRGEAPVVRLVPEPAGASPPPGAFDMAALEDFHRRFPVRFGGMAALIREMRDMDDH